MSNLKAGQSPTVARDTFPSGRERADAMQCLRKPIRMRHSASALAVILVWMSLSTGCGAEPRRLFHLSFDGNPYLLADIAAGNPSPVISEDVLPGEGLDGRGILMQGQAILAYEEAGNLDKARGCIQMWIKPKFDREDAPDFPCFFKEDAPLGPPPVNNIWLWMWNQSRFGLLRYDMVVQPGMGDVIYTAIPGGVDRDTWHQLAINWDCTTGTQIFVDGQKMPSFVSDKPYGTRQFQWEPRQHQRFFIGSRGRDTYHTAEPRWGACHSVIDEFAIYARPLSEKEVLESYVNALARGNVAPIILVRQAAAIEGADCQPVFDLKNTHSFAMAGKIEVTLKDSTGGTPLVSESVSLEPFSQATVRSRAAIAPDGGHYRLIYRYNGRKIGEQPFTVLPKSRSRGVAAPPALLRQHDAVAMRRDGTHFRESTPSTVKSLGGARYVEAGAELHGRIAFRFRIQHPGRPHLLKVFYPDDAERVFDIIVNSPAHPCTYDTQGGVLTGMELENSSQVQCYELLYWPRETQQALILTTWAEGLPAAICGFEVWELDAALPSGLPADLDGKVGRRLGLYWEDPMISECFGGSRGEQDGLAFAEETIDRMISYMRWTGLNTLIYPIYFYQGPQFQTLTENLIAGGEHRHPEEYIDLILRRFEELGDLSFIPSVNMCLSASMLLPIEQYMNRPSEGYLAIDRNGEMNTGLFPRINVLHPLYQDRFAEHFRELCRRFGASTAFKGVQLHLVYESPFWFGDLSWGYDDYTISMFQRETGIQLPTFTGDNRYSQRHQWLVGEKRAEWMQWRCRKLTDFYARLARILSSARSDLKLILGLRYLAEGSRYLPHWEEAGRSMAEVYRHGGLDFPSLHEIPNLEVQKYFFPSDIKWRKMRQRGFSMYAGLELRRSAELRDTLTLSGTQPVSTNLYVGYFESDVGSREPIEDFWWECPRWRVAGPSPGARNFLELFAESVAAYDAPTITTGGYVVGTMGNNEQIREFARAYCALPAVRFSTIPGSSDTAVVRWGQGGYLYAVSRSPFDLAVRLRSADPMELVDLSDGSLLKGQDLRVDLKPYQLRSFRGAPAADALGIAGYDLPPQRAQVIRDAISKLRPMGAAGAKIAARLEHELKQLNYVICKHILEEEDTLSLLNSQ